ncbi:TPA: hypothetical protein ACSHSI_004698 [Serratia marcescens]
MTKLVSVCHYTNDTESAERVAFDTRIAQINVRQFFYKAGLSESLFNSENEAGER